MRLIRNYNPTIIIKTEALAYIRQSGGFYPGDPPGKVLIPSTADSLLQTIRQFIDFRGGQARLRMLDQVDTWRHFALLNHFDKLILFKLAVQHIGKIKFLASFAHIMLYQPGYRGNIAIPGPNRFIAVAIETCLFRKLPRPRAIPLWFLDYRWVLVVAPNR
jgi:hypothetical protein